MSRKILAWFSLLGLVLAACQPIPPPPGSATTTITSTVVMTDTAIITDTTLLIATDAITTVASNTVTSTPQGEVTNESARSCPAIETGTLDVKVLPNWQAGDHVAYLTEQTKLEFSGSQQATTLAASTPITLTVIGVEEDGYLLELAYGQSQLGQTDIELPNTMASLLQTPLEVTIDYTVDSEGIYVGINNLEELQAQVLPLFDRFFEAMIETEPDTPPEVVEAARGMIDQLVSDPANFELLFTGEIQLFHSVYGITFTAAEPIVIEDIRPNLLGGAPIPSELVITPIHYDAEMGCLRIEFENIADPVAARNSILEALQIQARQMGVPGPRDQDLPSELHMIDKVIFEFDLNRGWPTYIFTERSVTIGNQGQIETSEYTLLEEVGE